MTIDYNDFPNHPLNGIDPEILKVARHVMYDAVTWGDVQADMAEPLADAVVQVLREAGFIQ